MTLAAFGTGGNPAVETDYFVQANHAVNALASLFVGADHARDSPAVNPLYVPERQLRGLCPQLIFVGGAEFALQDAKRWADVCGTADVEHELVVEWAQMHVYALGSAWVEPRVRRETDGRIVGWIKDHVGNGRVMVA